MARQVRPFVVLCLALSLCSCSHPAGDVAETVDYEKEDLEGKEQLQSAIGAMMRLEYTIFKRKDEFSYTRFGPIIVDSPEDVERLRETLSNSLGTVKRNSMPFGEIMMEWGQGTYITTVERNLQTKRLRLQLTSDLEFFQNERWTTKLNDGSFWRELQRIAIEQSQDNPRLVMNIERQRPESAESSN